VNEGDIALACMGMFVDGLVSNGMMHACVSPGARSTPLALALWRDPRVRVHVHLDERSSAFFGLGLAKATGEPVAVACTSGTAAANLYPAVVEAWMSRVPLVLLTADRPPELRGVGANQTIDQLELFGKYVTWFVDADVPTIGADGGEAWFGLGARAAIRARGHPPGPAHVNLPFREPLTPSGDAVETRRAAFAPVESAFEAPRPSASEVDSFVDELSGTERAVILAGSLRTPAPSIVGLAHQLAWPLIAEPTSGLRVPGALRAGQFLLGNEGFAESHAPDVVLQIGGAPTSRPGLALAGKAKRLVVVDRDRLVADPGRNAARTVEADPERLAGSIVDRLPRRGVTGWLRRWSQADRIVRRAVDDLIDSWDEPFEGRIARDLAAAIPDGGTLAVGSSMPVRDLDVYMSARTGLRVLANRGASGIDGFVSTVLGISAAGAPTFGLLGDLTLLHDAGALLWSARHGYDAVFVVPNNDGGAIFTFLPQRDLPEFRELFVTPLGLDVGSVAQAAGAHHALVEKAGDLHPAVTEATRSGGVWIVEVPSDREENVARHLAVQAAVAAELASLA
jgi:2-succinyl-5-enolpyruvyl-6-hydroxy-3-cyclohexene-1-carboxylate synthase